MALEGYIDKIASSMLSPRLRNLLKYSKQNGILKMGFGALTAKRLMNRISATCYTESREAYHAGGTYVASNGMDKFTTIILCGL